MIVTQLQPDGKSCPDMPSEFLVIAHRADIRIISFDVNYAVDIVLPIANLKNAVGVDVNRRTGELYWTDTADDVIRKASFDGRTIETIINNGIENADSLIVDSIGKKVRKSFKYPLAVFDNLIILHRFTGQMLG